MKIICNQDHRLHFPKGELVGGQLVRPYECPERWDYVMQSLKDQGLTDHSPPDPLDMSEVRQIHSPEFLAFLETAWHQWEQEGFDGEAIPTVIPARRMRQREPNHIDGKLGYFCMAIETAITRGTWQAAQSSAAIAQTAQKTITHGETSAFALCRPPGHHAASDLYGGYCFLNNAAIAAQGFLTMSTFITETALRIFFIGAMMFYFSLSTAIPKTRFHISSVTPMKPARQPAKDSITTTLCRR